MLLYLAIYYIDEQVLRIHLIYYYSYPLNILL